MSVAKTQDYQEYLSSYNYLSKNFQFAEQKVPNMASRHVYNEDDIVDDHLLRQISKFVRYDQLGALSGDLGITETERQRAVAKKFPQDEIFQVCN